MKIGIISTRGIPNNYGGFEEFAEYVSVGLVERGHEVVVYSPHYHEYKESSYKGVRIKHIYSPENWMGGSIGSFFYDFSSFRDALYNEDFDILYVAGYTSMAPSYIWNNVKNLKRTIVVTNMDGLEYKRTKFNQRTQKFLFWSEKTAVKHSHYLVADNIGIQDYYKEKYGKESKFLAYGTNIDDNFDPNLLAKVNLVPYTYSVVVARLEPENNIEMIIKGYLKSNPQYPLAVVGNTNTPHGKHLVKEYGNNDLVKFVGGIYNLKKLDAVRYYANMYFHGHSVGGTNPSLLEAMSTRCFILAHDNMFNRSVLKEDALYFNSSEEIVRLLAKAPEYIEKYKTIFVENNLKRLRESYSWDKLVENHESYFWKLVRIRRAQLAEEDEKVYGGFFEPIQQYEKN